MNMLPPDILSPPGATARRWSLRGLARVVLAGCALWLALAVAVPAVLAASTLPEERAVAASEAQLGGLVAAFDEAEAAYRAQLVRVDALRRRVATRPREIGQLQEALSGAQSMAETLVALELDVRAGRRALEERRAIARAALVRAIAEAETAGDATRIAALQARLDAVQAPLPAFAPPPIARIAEVPYETPEQLRAAADELDDVMGSVRQRLEALEAEERRAQVQERVNRRARGFATDERFLDDGERSRLRPVAVAAAGRGGSAGEQTVGGIAEPAPGGLAGAGAGSQEEAAAAPEAAPEAAPPSPGADFDPGNDGDFGNDDAPPRGAGETPLPPPPPPPDPVTPGVPRAPDVAPTPASWPRVVGPEEDDARDRGWDRASDRAGRGDAQRDPLAVERVMLEAELRRVEQTRALLLRRADELERRERRR